VRSGILEAYGNSGSICKRILLAAEFFTAEVAEDAEGAERTRLGSREARETLGWLGRRQRGILSTDLAPLVHE